MAVTQGVQLTQPRPDLADALIQFDLDADQRGFVGQRLFPVIEVEKSFGEYPVFELKELLGDEETLRSADGSYNATSLEGNKDSYRTKEHGLEARVDARDDAEYAEWWDAEMMAATITRDRVLRAYEKRCIALAQTVSTSTGAGTTWSTKATATPYTNVLTAKIAVRDRTGIWPDSLCLDMEAFLHLRNTNDMLERIFGSVNPENAGTVTAQQLANALDLREVIVAGSVKNSANEGQAASIASMWPRTTALLFKGGSGGRISNLVQPRLGATFHWGEDGSQIGAAMEEYEDPKRRGKIIRHRMDEVEKLIYAGLGQKITGVLS